MKILKYAILALVLLNLPSIVLVTISSGLGSVLSYLTYALLIAYFVFEKGGKPNNWILILGISYFLISGVNFYSGEVNEYYISFIKFLIVIFCGSVLVKKTTKNDIFIFLTIGSISILIEAFFFANIYGRYGGLYINPNLAGFIVIMAYALTFGLPDGKKRIIAQILITICGLVTFSRTFIVMWVLVNLISIKINIKNVRILGAGFGLLVLLVIFGELFKLNTIRLKQFGAIINQEQGALKEANKGSRSETWAYYYDYILEKPLVGNGYKAFQKNGLPPAIGVHNSYLLIIGESGIFPFLLFIGLIGHFIYTGIRNFKYSPHLLMQSLTFAIFMMAFHNFFAIDSVLIIALWIAYQHKLASAERKEALLMGANETRDENSLISTSFSNNQQAINE